jgi:hypothetical protein
MSTTWQRNDNLLNSSVYESCRFTLPKHLAVYEVLGCKIKHYTNVSQLEERSRALCVGDTSHMTLSTNSTCEFDFRGSVHHSTIRKEKSNKIQQCIKIFIIPYLYEAQHVSGDTAPISRSLNLHWQPLVFHRWKALAQCAWQRPLTTRPTTFHLWKPRGCQCSFRLLMMGGVSPETCWALYRYGIINILIHCCIWLDFFLRRMRVSVLL